jgi:hypothetical protein
VLRIVLIILAVTTIGTAIQRIVWVYQHAKGVPLDPPRTARRPADADEDFASGQTDPS